MVDSKRSSSCLSTGKRLTRATPYAPPSKYGLGARAGGPSPASESPGLGVEGAALNVCAAPGRAQPAKAANGSLRSRLRQATHEADRLSINGLQLLSAQPAASVSLRHFPATQPTSEVTSESAQ